MRCPRCGCRLHVSAALLLRVEALEKGEQAVGLCSAMLVSRFGPTDACVLEQDHEGDHQFEPIQPMKRADSEPIEACLAFSANGHLINYRVTGKTLADIAKQWPSVMHAAEKDLAVGQPLEPFSLPFEAKENV